MEIFVCAAFQVVKEEQLYKRYLTLYNRRIHFPASEGRPVSLLTELCVCTYTSKISYQQMSSYVPELKRLIWYLRLRNTILIS